MNLIISNTNYKHNGYEVYNSMKNVEWETVDCLIFSDSLDSELEIILSIADAFTKVDKLIYITDKLNPLYISLFKGMGGDIYDDVSLLQDDETLNYLVEDYGTTGMTIKDVDTEVETIVKLLTTLSNENAKTLEKLIKNGFWLKSIENSVSTVSNEIQRVDKANKTMVELFNRTSDMVKHFGEESIQLQHEIEALTKSLELAEKNYGKPTMQSTPYYFPTFQVPPTVSKVLYVRVYSPCRFLVTFFSAYQHYLKMEKRLKSKLLIATPKLKQFLHKYGEFPRLDTETVGTLNLPSLGDTLVTFEPKNTVLNAFFNMKVDVHIVIDMMYGDNLIAGYKVEHLNAITSLSDIERFELKDDRTLISLRGKQSNILIPYMKEINSEKPVTTIYTLYNESCNGSAYEKINKILFGRL